MDLTRLVVVVVIVGFFWFIPNDACCETVYDSLTGATTHGGAVIIHDSGSQAGNIITLVGHSRRITRAQVAISGFRSGNVDFKINFWTAIGKPGDLIWSSPIQRSGPLLNEPSVFTVDVPHIEVPNKFGWTVENVASFGTPGLPGYPGATVGNADFEWFSNIGTGWEVNPYVPTGQWSLGFLLIAVPEPNSWVIVCGLFILNCGLLRLRLTYRLVSNRRGQVSFRRTHFWLAEFSQRPSLDMRVWVLM